MQEGKFALFAASIHKNTVIFFSLHPGRFWLLAKSNLPLPALHTDQPSGLFPLTPIGWRGRSSTPFSADSLCSGLLPQTHGCPPRPETRERVAGRTHECKDRWFWYVTPATFQKHSQLPGACWTVSLEHALQNPEPVFLTTSSCFTWKAHSYKHQLFFFFTKAGITYCRLLLYSHQEWSSKVICKSSLDFSVNIIT